MAVLVLAVACAGGEGEGTTAPAPAAAPITAPVVAAPAVAPVEAAVATGAEVKVAPTAEVTRKRTLPAADEHEAGVFPELEVPFEQHLRHGRLVLERRQGGNAIHMVPVIEEIV